MDSSEALVAWHAIAEEPRLVCNREGEVVWTNAAARDYARKNLARGDSAEDPHTIWRSMMASGLFTQILNRAVTCPVGKMRSVHFDLNDPESPIILKVIPLAADSEAPIGITIPLEHKLSPEVGSDLKAIYGLSGAELRILADLVAGKTLSTSAMTSGTSIYTVRTHLRNIYQKLRVSNREAMFNLLAPYL
ncbi:helix-turn-helix transcriptional regulator [Aquidulcibacter sp.]|uniref:helix-turn-helix transcriptional regulator n=1 Tax=Aquidulcibacter sp. TaxID=2052990 RepID=UPI00269751BB